MSNKDILEKAITKAIEGGWQPWWRDDRWEVDETPYIKTYNDIYDSPGYMELHYMMVIFNHDFAKALWGQQETEADLCPACDTYTDIAAWKYHLQQMVIASDPIKYLGEHI